MRRICGLTLVLVGVTFLAAEQASADLYVVQVGDGAAALSNASTAGFIKKFDNIGTAIPAGDIALPIAASGSNSPLTFSGTATTEGFLNLSPNGQYLTVAGYGIAPGQAAVTATTAAVAPRVAGVVDLVGSPTTINTTTSLSGDNSFSGSTGNAANPRSAVTTNGSDIWIAGTAATGSNGGVRYTTLGSHTSTQLSSSPTNTRVVTIQNNQLYTSSGTTAFLGPATIGTGVPTTSGQTTTLLSGFPTSTGPSPLDYWFKDANTVYLADDRSVANGGGIQKWTLSSGTWSLAYTLAVGTTVDGGARGVAGTIVGGDAVLFATSSMTTNVNHLVTVTDTGAGSAFTVLATAPASTQFRGVEFISAALAGDYNGDHKVDAADYTIWRDNQGAPEVPVLHGNGDGSGTVDDGDFTRWKDNFNGANGSGGGGLGAAPVPEPASVVLFALGVVGLLVRFGRRTR